MVLRPARPGYPKAGEPVIHELPPIRYEGTDVPLRIAVRRAEDGTWRGRLIFGPGEVENAPTTAEIFCEATESEFWQAVRNLRNFHLCNLYRSLHE
jgi:hypothetical protein